MKKEDGLRVRVSYNDTLTNEPEEVVWISRQDYKRYKKEVAEMNVGIKVLRKQFPNDGDLNEIDLNAYIVYQVNGDTLDNEQLY